MSVNGVTTSPVYKDPTSYDTYTKPQEEKVEEKKDDAAVYEKSEEKETDSAKTIYGKDNSALISKLKKDAEDRVSNLRNLVEKMMSKQGDQSKLAGDDFWKKLASGDFTVDEETRLEAQASIEGDGEFSVKTVSENILSFAKALTGGDPEKAEKMREAFQQGFDEATEAWGKELPQISKDTYDAVMKGFDEWQKETAAVQ